MQIPSIGSAVPRRGTPFSRWLGRTAMRLGGWQFEGEVPDAPKFIIIGAPHTSNWDFLVVMSAALALAIDVKIMAKHTLMRGPLAPIMRWCGVFGIDRRRAGGVVGQMAEKFRQADKLTMAIAPDGSRTASEHWKNGFWRIARAADIPVLPCALDYGRRRVRFGPLMRMSSDIAADLAALTDFYLGTRGARRTIDRPISFKDIGAEPA
ncbi:lysophospholipid acyltransferase family protein [Rhodospirillum centenum]|uniref:Acyltransferase, putative n=1 Tax=Rhodospirillum centenum (strain ATCC 51521 / SW) TaxID=414684 RepID=B6IQ29_RHOCS|nr:lysophospholipid acyltransferase family protein [Rhodospirillum centenum]ACI97565.1 acyltransferase, putative [Rhodospirillum centenum SW]